MTMPGRALVDTSAWIDALREDGDAAIAGAVRELAADGEAVLCDLVRVELWNGAGGDAEKKLLRELERELECLPTTQQVWATARELARACRAKGVTVPATDLVVAACARVHGLPLVHHDSHFEQIARATGSDLNR
jgi:predicted nucleic acid-binding protein